MSSVWSRPLRSRLLADVREAKREPYDGDELKYGNWWQHFRVLAEVISMLDATTTRECVDASDQLWVDAAKCFSLCRAGSTSCVEKTVLRGKCCDGQFRGEMCKCFELVRKALQECF